MLYVFKVVDLPWFKFGYTDQTNPWNRIQTGFWTNVHPKELCGKLGAEQFQLIHVFQGDKRLEHCMQSIFPPYAGEFWKDEDLDDFVWILKLIADEIPIPPKTMFH